MSNAGLPRGLTTWKGAAVRKADVMVAKNYPSKDEIDELNRIVVMWLDYAEDQARRRKQIFLHDWDAKLDDFLAFNERRVLPNAGTVSKDVADTKAAAEYEPRDGAPSLKRKPSARPAGRSKTPRPSCRSRSAGRENHEFEKTFRGNKRNSRY